MARSTTLIDTDGHVFETLPELWPFLEAPYQSREDFEYLGINGAIPSAYGWPLAPGASRRRWLTRDAPTGAAQFYGVGPEGWLAFMDDAGIERTVLYPSSGGLMLGVTRDIDWACAFARAYNNWMAQTFMGKSSRLQAAAVLPMQDVPEAVKELRRAVTELGMVAGMLNGGLDHLLGDEVYWPLYEEAERLDCPVVSHGGPGRGPGFNVDYMGFGGFTEMHTLHQPINNLLQLNSMVFRGVLQRFSRLKVFIAEVGCEWVPYWMDRADEEWEFSQLPGALPGAPKPSEAIKSGRVFFQAADYERNLASIAPMIGADNLVFSSDYPHELGSKTPGEINEAFDALEQSLDGNGGNGLTEKVFNLNAHRLYRLS